MRHFNKREQQIITRLIEEFSVEKELEHFQLFLKKILEEKNCRIDYEKYLTHELSIHAPENKKYEIANEIIEIVFLFDTLKKERYLSLIHSDIEGIQKNSTVLGKNNVEQDGHIKILDREFFELFNEFYRSKLFPSSELIHLKINNFISDEEKRHKKIMNVTWTSIAIAFVIGLSGIIINIFCGCMKNETKQNEIVTKLENKEIVEKVLKSENDSTFRKDIENTNR